jgi:glycogen(starch) synthase
VVRSPTSRFVARIGWPILHGLFTLRGFRLATGRLMLANVQFCSEHLKQAALEAGQPVATADVVHWGIDVEKFSPAPASSEQQDRRKRLLFVGQVVGQKGVHTAIEALRLLHDAGHRDVRLTIVGGSRVPAYEAQVRGQAASSGVQNAVRFTGVYPREKLPEIYRDHGILLFPSCWDEPFAITPLEAMASGLAVVGTTRGGSREIFEHNVNALTFPAEDPQACAHQLQRLLADWKLYRDLIARGRATILDRFKFTNMVDRIERRLRRARDGG